MEDVKVLDIVESETVGRWVLATVGGYDDSISYELTFVPDLRPDEWKRVCAALPRNYRITGLCAVGGELLGRRRALMATLT